ncbi:thioredoxin domain-containing protein [Maribellus sediminis]|uniref:thioredoxin domain-containing protein n=1 Tax=Maribellus sediminis TaxID=2696285 RepID=UPI00142FB206|nr:thioredoxin domain-containing protein [Maribellus sediminis]
MTVDHKYQKKYTNALIDSTSPYLLQHAHNPVNWQPWSEAALEQAEQEGKLLLVSIGYAACHWCHVMEHESFEDEAVAEIMNKHFVCIKVDREERPDIDHYYMSAVQLMMQQGGWPLNVIALPNGQPIWGGTYFPKESWMHNLKAVFEFYQKEPAKTKQYAQELKEGIRNISLGAELEEEIAVDASLLKTGVENWKTRFDMEDGGRVGAPKFPMPVNLDFLLYYAHLKKDDDTLKFVKLTLDKMARGGIYDHVGGGFARYSVDDKWKVPHFEKMLYDNGQLLSIYSKAFQQFKSHEFECIVYEIADWLEREMTDESGAFYSSLDADSEGEEGKFYVWQKHELKEVIDTDFELFKAYYNINKKGFWENGNYILLRDQSDENFAETNDLSLHRLQLLVGNWKYKLLKKRTERVRPGLDDKTLSSWNALVIIGLIDAYKAFNDSQFLRLALRNAEFLQQEQIKKSGKVYHSWKKGRSTIDGFLEDYALLIQAFLALFETTAEERWLKLARRLTDYVFDHFYDSNKSLFYFSEKEAGSAIGNHFQNEDNVIPAANSVMANNLHRLYLILGQPDYLVVVKKMLLNVTPHFTKYPMAYANWGSLMLKLTEPFYEVVVCGINSNLLMAEMKNEYHPNILWAHSSKESKVPILQNRFHLEEDLIYVCKDGECHLPTNSPEAARKLILP